MTLAEFKNWAITQGSVAKYDDGQFKGECVSLVNQYCWRVLGVPAGAWGNAADWATNANVAKYFDKVSTIQAGDILVYPNKAVPYGHIAIALNGSQMLDQNGDYGRKVAVRNIWANPVILRKKGSNMSKITQAEVGKAYNLDGRTASAADKILHSTKGTVDSVLTGLIKDSASKGNVKRINDLKVTVANQTKSIATLKATIAAKDAEIAALKARISELEKNNGNFIPVGELYVKE
jgi:uncharacterized coiled-coil protein SlyX